jgi:hypothetical protein
VAALAALRSREDEERNSGREHEYEDFLVVYDLFAPNSQLPQFASAVKKMATALHPWRSILYITHEQMEALDAELTVSNRPEIFARVREMVGAAQADEVYLCRNWQFGNRLILHAYRDELKVCYGDSIGIYFSEAYFSPAVAANGPSIKTVVRQQLGRLKRGLRSRLTSAPPPENQKLRGYDVLSEIEFDVGYFLLPEILRETPPMETRLVNKTTTGKLFRQLAQALNPEQIAAQYGYLSKVPTVILMTSNFSEALRMPAEKEIAGYRTFLEELQLPRESALVIKPHPRDGAEKIQVVGRALSDLFSEVVLLTDQNLFFTPFEVFLLQAFLDDNGETPRDLKIITFSTACLSLPVLFNLNPIIGFGSELVKTSFFEDYITGRLRHEEDLQLAVRTLASHGDHNGFN